MKGILCLEDGRIFNGTIFGDPKIKVGEICFNTSMSGYQEIITDPLRI
jgi:carbamoyl-phosphate synthase small subunit